jgi:bacterioferritin
MASFVKDVEEIRRRAQQKLEDGPVTATYKGDKDRTIEILNEALATEIVCVLRYMHHYFMATGVHGRGVASEFKEHADAEREHSEEIAERIQQLGGKPDFNPASLLQRSVSQYVEGETLADMIREDLIAERIVIEVYQEMIRYFRDNDPTTRVMIEHILSEEEEHASDLSDLLYVVDPRTGETEGRDPGTDPIELRNAERKIEREARTNPSAEEEYEPSPARSASERSARSGKAERFPNPVERVAGRDREYDGTQQINVQRNSGASQRSEQKTRRGGAPTGSKAQNEPAHAPGTSGRTMNRRKRMERAETEEPAQRPNRGGMSGGTRSPKVLEKNRKNKRVA